MERSDYQSEARLLSMEDLKEGQGWREKRVVTREFIQKFIDLTDDRALIHVDSDHAGAMGFDGCLVHGFLVASGYSRLLGMFLPGSNTVIHKVELDMMLPVYEDDMLEYQVKVERIVPAVRTVLLGLTTTNQHKKLVNRGKATCIFRR
jgi:acyl dehydratase